MKTATILTVALLFALGATAAWAQCPPEPVCPAPVVTCPAPAPVCPPAGPVCPAPEPVCPAPVVECPPRCCPTQMTTPTAQCPCPTANPAAWGAGPAGDLTGLECQDFDKAYIERMYNLNSTIIALTGEGIQRTTDRNLRDISGEIRTTKTEENIRLASWYSQMGYGTIPVNFERTQAVIGSLNEPMGACFDVAYAQTLSGLLKQSRDANGLAAGQGAFGELMAQANTAGSRDSNYVFRLDRWVTEHGGVY